MPVATYSDFFRRTQHFLLPDLSAARQASIKGVSSADHQRLSLEVGSGVGRFTEVLRSVLAPAARLICLEPSTGVFRAERCDPRLSWVRADYRHPPFRDGVFSAIVLHGVLPHIDEPVSVTLKRTHDLLSDGGRVQLCRSWYPFLSEASFHWLRGIATHLRLVRVIAALLATVMPFAFRIPRLLAVFPYSPQKTWLRRYTQYIETLSIQPYDLFQDYRDTADALLEAGFGELQCYAHAVSVTGTKGRDDERPLDELARSLRGSHVLLVGDGALARHAKRRLRHHCTVMGMIGVREVTPRPDVDWYVLATDYPFAPYEDVLPRLEALGLRWGQRVTSWQLACSALEG